MIPYRYLNSCTAWLVGPHPREILELVQTVTELGIARRKLGRLRSSVASLKKVITTETSGVR